MFETWELEDVPFLLGPGRFSGTMLGFHVCIVVDDWYWETQITLWIEGSAAKNARKGYNLGPKISFWEVLGSIGLDQIRYVVYIYICFCSLRYRRSFFLHLLTFLDVLGRFRWGKHQSSSVNIQEPRRPGIHMFSFISLVAIVSVKFHPNKLTCISVLQAVWDHQQTIQV